MVVEVVKGIKEELLDEEGLDEDEDDEDDMVVLESYHLIYITNGIICQNSRYSGRGRKRD